MTAKASRYFLCFARTCWKLDGGGFALDEDGHHVRMTIDDFKEARQ